MEEPDRPGGGRDDGQPQIGPPRPEVAALVDELREGIRALRALPLEGVPPALGDPVWP